MGIPDSTLQIPSTAQYDSIKLLVYMNNYYYGDTTKSITITASELAQPIDYTYSNLLFNTSSIPVKPVPLGSSTVVIRPNVNDSFFVRLNDIKGTELFNKLVQQDPEVNSTDAFLNYFRGISLSVNSSDTSVLYGIGSTAGKIIMRIYYHRTTPYFENDFVDFSSLSNSYSFNQVVTDRTNTLLYSSSPGNKEFPSAQTNDLAFTQFGAGVLLKITFPSLKGILQSDDIIKLLKAELIIRPADHTYNGNLQLPPLLHLAQADATNVIGTSVPDSVGNSQDISPVIDNIYGANTYYRFNVTSSIANFLNTAGSEQSGFFLLDDNSPPGVDRAVIGNIHSNYKTQLLLTVAIISK